MTRHRFSHHISLTFLPISSTYNKPEKCCLGYGFRPTAQNWTLWHEKSPTAIWNPFILPPVQTSRTMQHNTSIRTTSSSRIEEEKRGRSIGSKSEKKLSPSEHQLFYRPPAIPPERRVLAYFKAISPYFPSPLMKVPDNSRHLIVLHQASFQA